MAEKPASRLVTIAGVAWKARVPCCARAGSSVLRLLRVGARRASQARRSQAGDRARRAGGRSGAGAVFRPLEPAVARPRGARAPEQRRAAGRRAAHADLRRPGQPRHEQLRVSERRRGHRRRAGRALRVRRRHLRGALRARRRALALRGQRGAGAPLDDRVLAAAHALRRRDAAAVRRRRSGAAGAGAARGGGRRIARRDVRAALRARRQ